jgi:hypothetical protein
MGHAVLLEKAGRLFSITPAGDSEAEMVQAHPVGIRSPVGAISRKPSTLRGSWPRRRTWTPNVSASGRVGGRRRLRATSKPSRLGRAGGCGPRRSLPAAGGGISPGGNLPWHCFLFSARSCADAETQCRSHRYPRSGGRQDKRGAAAVPEDAEDPVPFAAPARTVDHLRFASFLLYLVTSPCSRPFLPFGIFAS